MIIPKNNRIYEYNNERVIVWSQTPLKNVNIRTVVENGGSEYKTANWLNFALHAKYIDKIKFNKNF